jgi:hypothetical protein
MDKKLNREEVYHFIGGSNEADKISKGISSYAMQRWIYFQEQKMYESLGYTSFNDFLNKSPYSPMGKSNFYEKRKLLLKEGAPLFDLFNMTRIPERNRKLLREGQIEVVGDKVVIRQDDDDEKIEIKLNDKVTLIETLTEVLDQNAVQKTTIKRKDEHIERGEKKIEALNKEKQITRHKQALKLDPYGTALANWVSASNVLINEIAKLPAEHVKTAASNARHKFETVRLNMARLYDPDDPNDLKSDLEDVYIDPQEEGIIQAMKGGKNEIIH